MAIGWISVAVVVVAYLLGTLPTAAVVGARVGRDPRAEGSQNPGATNVYRLAGWRAGATVLVIDVAKGAGASGLGLVAGDRRLALAAGVAAVLGHVAPITRRFRGGKGVATAGGAVLVLWPLVALALVVVFVVVVAAVRIASLGSLAMSVGLPLGVWIGGHESVEIAGAAAIALLVVVRHHENITRLLRGEEGAFAPGRIQSQINPRERPQP